ncbi:hypothetical protein GG804_13265 [Sphingomonas histidinilytica]|nr:hypothetical protein [Rhizorhabdus histidinilytica]QEH81880.1 hypothetical protein EIK56_15935 [Sphingomonas sp. C8-2]
MKAIFAAIGLAVAAFGMSGTAEARDRWDDRRWSHDRHWDNDRHWNGDRRWHRDRHWDRRWHRDARWDRRHHGRRCWTEWRWNHRVRVCR